MTTLTCLVDMVSWNGYSSDEIMKLLGLYLPYLVIGMSAFQSRLFVLD